MTVNANRLVTDNPITKWSHQYAQQKVAELQLRRVNEGKAAANEDTVAATVNALAAAFRDGYRAAFEEVSAQMSLFEARQPKRGRK